MLFSISSTLATLRIFAALSFLLLIGIAQGKPFAVVQFPKDIVLPENVLHPVNLFGGPEREVVVAGKGKLRIYSASGKQAALLQEIQLPAPREPGTQIQYGFARVFSPAVYNILLLLSDGVYVYPTAEDHVVPQPQPLLAVTMSQEASAGSQPRFFEFAVDMDNDQYDELLLPQKGSVSLYRRNGSEGYNTVPLPRNPAKRENLFYFHADPLMDPARIKSISGSVTYQSGVDDLLLFDANGDARIDLIYASTTHGATSRENEKYDIFLQKNNLTFETEPSQTIEVPYEGDADVSFRDFNADARLDAMIIRSNYDLINPRTAVKIYIAGTQKYQLFERETDRFVTKDPIGLVKVADLNNDGLHDFAMTYFSYKFGSTEDLVDLIVANKVRFKLQCYLGRGKQGFSRAPDYEKEITLNMKFEAFTGYQPVMLIPDASGDGIMDLLVRSDEDKLAVYLSAGSLRFADSPNEVLDVPADAEITVTDMNSDGLQDLIISSLQKNQLSVYLSAK